jgi:hypothetical protein
MAGFLGNAKTRTVLAGAILVLAAGCGARHSDGPHAVRAGTAPARPSPPVTGYVKQASFLTGVACTSARACVAVGSYYYGAGPRLALAARWNGRAWLTEPTPDRGKGQLSGVSCPRDFVASCVALGAPAQVWNGARWAVIPAAGPMSSLSCTGPGSCQAVGPLAGRHPVAAHWDGRTWQAEPVPRLRPAPQTLVLASVSCTSATFCMAVGDASRGAGARPSRAYRDITLAAMWNGSRWRMAVTPSPSRASELSGVSCTSPRACTAVGSTANRSRALAERWNGLRWAVQRTPSAGRTGYTVLTAVSCASPAACTAVGDYNGGAFGIAEHWNGARWAIQRLPAPPGPPGEGPLVLPAGVSCISATACVMVGTMQNRTLAEAWDGSGWTVQPAPGPLPR